MGKVCEMIVNGDYTGAKQGPANSITIGRKSWPRRRVYTRGPTLFQHKLGRVTTYYFFFYYLFFMWIFYPFFFPYNESARTQSGVLGVEKKRCPLELPNSEPLLSIFRVFLRATGLACVDERTRGGTSIIYNQTADKATIALLWGFQ